MTTCSILCIWDKLISPRMSYMRTTSSVSRLPQETYVNIVVVIPKRIPGLGFGKSHPHYKG